MKKEYTAEETAKFKADRNARSLDQYAHRRGTLVWDNSRRGTFVGSIRQQFTGARRNNQISH